MNMNGTARALRHLIGIIITELYGSKVLMNSVLWDVGPSPPTRPALTSQLHKTKKLRKVKQKLNQKPSVLYFIIHCTHSLTQTICAIYLVHCIMGSLVLIILQWLKVNASFQFVSRIFFWGLEGVMSRNLKTTTSHLQINSFNETISQWPWPGEARFYI